MVVKAGLIPIVAFINWRWQICGYFEWLVVLEGGISGKIIFRMMILEVSLVLTTLTIQSRLRWWDPVQRMGEDRLPKQIFESSVGGKRGKGRRRRRWEDSVGNDLDVRDLSWEVARELARDRGRWRRVVKGGVDGRTPNTA